MNRADVLITLGQYPQAEEEMKQAIVVLERNRRTHQRELADALMNLANLYLAQGELPQAEKLLLRSIELKKQSFGPNHYQVALTQNNLAELYRMLGQLDKAADYHLSSLAFWKRRWGQSMPTWHGRGRTWPASISNNKSMTRPNHSICEPWNCANGGWEKTIPRLRERFKISAIST